MKKKIINLIVLFGILICLPRLIHAEILSSTFKFNENEFQITAGNGDSLVISSISSPAIYNEEGQPGLPFIIKNIALTGNEIINGFDIKINKRLIRTNADVATAHRPLPTSMQSEYAQHNNNVQYESIVYPDSVCTLGSVFNIGGVPIVNLKISPFVYDAQKHELYFVDSLTVDLDLIQSPERQAPNALTQEQFDMLEMISSNTQDVMSLGGQISATPLFLGDYSYVIITNESLKEAFKPLAEWKKKKGVASHILTVEYIDKYYNEATIQMKIKKCLKTLWENNGLRYVLLGGDVDVVPAQLCYGHTVPMPTNKETHELDKTIPSDIYYSDVADLDWDTNKDGLSGDFWHDKISFSPNLYVTRAPVGTIDEAEIFVNRTIDYEQNPRLFRAILQSGGRTSPRETGRQIATNLFNEVIAGKVRIESFGFFDDYTHTGNPFTFQSFSDELSKGYQFAEVFSHGHHKTLSSTDYGLFFNSEKASELKNPNHTLFTTIACYTNNFDFNETTTKRSACLSEALIRNPNSGIIGYIGASRLGWGGPTPNALDYSAAYEAEFYKRLLYPELKPYDKNLGAVFTYAKMTLTGLAMEDQYYNYLHHSINCIGDPETPLFYDHVNNFSAATAEYDDNEQLIVATGYDDARICVSSKNSDKYYAVEYGDIKSFDTGKGSFDVWITRQNFKPRHFEVANRWIVERDSLTDFEIEKVPTIESVYPNPATSYFTIKHKRVKDDSVLMMSLSPVDGGQSYLYYISDPGDEYTVSVGGMPRGVYIVKLREDGVWGNAVRVILQ